MDFFFFLVFFLFFVFSYQVRQPTRKKLSPSPPLLSCSNPFLAAREGKGEREEGERGKGERGEVVSLNPENEKKKSSRLTATPAHAHFFALSTLRGNLC